MSREKLYNFKMISKKEVGKRIRQFGESHFKNMTDFAKALEMTTLGQLYVYLSGRSYPGFELLDKLRRLGMDIVALMKEQASEPKKVVAEESQEYQLDEKLRYRSSEEKKAVENAVNSLMYISRSYIDFSDENSIRMLRKILIEAELKRYRRYGSKEFQEFIAKWKNANE